MFSKREVVIDTGAYTYNVHALQGKDNYRGTKYQCSPYVLNSAEYIIAASMRAKCRTARLYRIMTKTGITLAHVIEYHEAALLVHRLRKAKPNDLVALIAGATLTNVKRGTKNLSDARYVVNKALVDGVYSIVTDAEIIDSAVYKK